MVLQLSAGERERLAELYAEPAVRALAGVCRAAGAGVWVVGGAVRDALTGREPQDLDLLVDVPRDELRAVLRAAGGAGQVTSAVLGTVRGHVRTPAGPVAVDLSPTPAAAAARTADRRARVLTDLTHRDLTVNALAMDAVSGELLDPCGGLRDVRERVLDTPHDPALTWGRDPIRMLRALRYHAVLQWSLSSRAADSLAEHVQGAAFAPERVAAELAKVEGAGPAAVGRFLTAAQHSGALRTLLPTAATACQVHTWADGADLDAALVDLVAGVPDPAAALAPLGLPRARTRHIVARAGALAGQIRGQRAERACAVPTLGVRDRRAP